MTLFNRRRSFPDHGSIDEGLWLPTSYNPASPQRLSFDKHVRDDEDIGIGIRRSQSEKCFVQIAAVALGRDSVPSTSSCHSSSVASSSNARQLQCQSSTVSRFARQDGLERNSLRRPSISSACENSPRRQSCSQEERSSGSQHMAFTSLVVERSGTAMNVSPVHSKLHDRGLGLGSSSPTTSSPNHISLPGFSLSTRSQHMPGPSSGPKAHSLALLLQQQPGFSTHSSHGGAYTSTGQASPGLGSYAPFPKAARPHEIRRACSVDIPGMSSAALAGAHTSHGNELGAEENSSSSDDEAANTQRLLAAAMQASSGTRSHHQRHSSWTPAPMPVGVGLTAPMLQVLTPTGRPSTPKSEHDLPRADLGTHSHTLLGSGPPSPQQQHSEDHPEDEGDVSGQVQRRRSSYHLTNSQAAVELFLRLNRARQTLDFARRQAAQFTMLNHCEMGIWDALSLLNELREYEAALYGTSAGLDPDMSLMEHAFQCAELCRLSHPEKDWMALVGLIHGLGKLLAHRKFGSQPQWAVCGESFPLGCKIDPQIQGAQFFLANPDRRKRAYNTPTGIYQPHCGLKNVFMSWGAAEFLYLVLLLNNTALPPEALFLLRFSKFTSLARPGSTYRQLMSAQDEALLPLLRDFQRATMYRRLAIPDELALGEPRRHAFYDGLIQKYMPGILSW